MIAINPDKINFIELFELVARAKAKHDFKTIIIHWTGCDYDTLSDNYHLNVGKDGTVYKTCWSFNELKNHTKRNNKGTIGIALDCGVGSEYRNLNRIFFGPCPPTQEQIVSLIWLIAGICYALDMEISCKTVKTHFEVAVSGGYGPGSGDDQSRWDLAKLPHNAIPLILVKESGVDISNLGGTLIRDLATFCYHKLLIKYRKEVSISRGDGGFFQTQLAF